MWALAIKSKLGNVYHRGVTATSSTAHCDHRIRIEARKFEAPPDDGRTCERCRNLDEQMSRKAAFASAYSPKDAE